MFFGAGVSRTDLFFGKVNFSSITRQTGCLPGITPENHPNTRESILATRRLSIDNRWRACIAASLDTLSHVQGL